MVNVSTGLTRSFWWSTQGNCQNPMKTENRTRHCQPRLFQSRDQHVHNRGLLHQSSSRLHLPFSSHTRSRSDWRFGSPHCRKPDQSLPLFGTDRHTELCSCPDTCHWPKRPYSGSCQSSRFSIWMSVHPGSQPWSATERCAGGHHCVWSLSHCRWPTTLLARSCQRCSMDQLFCQRQLSCHTTIYHCPSSSLRCHCLKTERWESNLVYSSSCRNKPDGNTKIFIFLFNSRKLVGQKTLSPWHTNLTVYNEWIITDYFSFILTNHRNWMDSHLDAHTLRTYGFFTGRKTGEPREKFSEPGTRTKSTHIWYQRTWEVGGGGMGVLLSLRHPCSRLRDSGRCSSTLYTRQEFHFYHGSLSVLRFFLLSLNWTEERKVGFQKTMLQEHNFG